MDAASLRSAIGAIWTDVLGVPVAEESDFFELGGDSLDAMHVVARVREATGARVRVRALIEAPTLASFAAAVYAAADTAGQVRELVVGDDLRGG